MCSAPEYDDDPSALALSRRLCLVRSAALGIATMIPAMMVPAISTAQATVLLPTGPKPDVPLWFRAGRNKPASPRTTAAVEPAVAPRAAAPADGRTVRTLALDNINTGERLTVTYMERGRYLPDALAEINRLMRDRRSGAVASINTSLLDLLSDICLRLDTRAPVRLISGYRAPATNREMRSQGRAVARKSYHTRGMAADIAVPGRSLGDLRRVAVALDRGGVGIYPGSGFVHVDVGPPRTWRG